MQLILGFERGEPPTRAFSTEAIHGLITFLTTTAELPTQGRWFQETGQTKLRGRGAGVPVVDKHMWSIKAIESGFNNRSGVDDRGVQSRLAELRKAHITRSAPSYDVVEVRVRAALGSCCGNPVRTALRRALRSWARPRRARWAAARRRAYPAWASACAGALTRSPQALPRLRTAIFSDEYNGKRNPVHMGILRVMLFTMLMLQHALIARASLLTDFCPTIEAIRLPDEDAQWDADGFPQFFTLHLNNWKGNTKRKQQVRAGCRLCCGRAQRAPRGAARRLLTRTLAQDLYVERNTVNPQFCPVVALMFWLRVLQDQGITHGPIFPAINARSGRLVAGMRMLPSYYEKWITAIFRHAGGSTALCSSHSVRRSAATWAARCGAPETEVQRVGRWKLGSISFRRYVENGMSIARRFLGRGISTTDPVFKFFVFRTSAILPD